MQGLHASHKNMRRSPSRLLSRARDVSRLPEMESLLTGCTRRGYHPTLKLSGIPTLTNLDQSL